MFIYSAGLGLNASNTMIYLQEQSNNISYM